MIALTNCIESVVINNKFRPDDCITRAQMAVIMNKAYETVN